MDGPSELWSAGEQSKVINLFIVVQILQAFYSTIHYYLGTEHWVNLWKSTTVGAETSPKIGVKTRMPGWK